MSERADAVVNQSPEEIFADLLKETVEKLQKHSLLPQGSWDDENLGEAIIRRYDQAFGGEWVIKTRSAKLVWSGKYAVTVYATDPIAAYLIFRAEIPMLHGQENNDPQAQRRWFLEQVRVVIRFPGGEQPFLELSAKDSILNTLELFAPQS